MNKKKKDYLSFTLLFQFLICTVLFFTLYGLKVLNSDIYLNLKDSFFSEISDNLPIIESALEAEEKSQLQVLVNTSTAESEESNHVEKTTVLEAEIAPTGGKDYHIDSISEVPSNVSVNSYSFNRKIVVPVKGEITSRFGVRKHPIYNELRFHAGIDIAAEQGTPILASFDGTVKEARYDEWNGNYLKIEHDGKVTTVYCHCEKLAVKKGDEVKAGDVVAYVGSTGSSTGPHLHFEIRIDNVSFDPETAIIEAADAV